MDVHRVFVKQATMPAGKQRRCTQQLA